MSSSTDNGVVFLMWLISVGISIAAGIYSWNWIEPESFWGFIGFLIVWGIVSRIGHFLASAVAILLLGNR